MASLISDARDSYDLVVIDTPPLVLLPDAFPLLRQADGVLIVSRLGANRRDVAARLRETLASVEAPVVGVIANGYKRPRGAPGYGYGYSYQYDYSSYTGPGQEFAGQAVTNGAGPEKLTRDR
jgi:polysaccharide biosynthesis transport protein